MKYGEQKIRNSQAAAYRRWRSERGDASLTPVIESLQHLLVLLQRDDTATWKSAFQQLLSQAVALRSTDFTQDDLTRLGAEIQKTRHGLDNFNDHVPSERGRTAIWIEDLDRRRRQVYEAATALFADLD